MSRYLLIISVILSCFAPRSGIALTPFEEILRAALENDVPTLRSLLSRGMAVDTSDPGGNTLLIIAAREGHVEATTFLAEQHANLGARNAVGDTAIMLAALKGHLEVVRLLRSRGAEVNQSGWTALHYCAWGGWTEVCRYLVEQGADVNARAPNKATPLMMAALEGHADTVELLLAHAADPALRNDADATALSLALKGDRREVVQILRRAGARN